VPLTLTLALTLTLTPALALALALALTLTKVCLGWVEGISPYLPISPYTSLYLPTSQGVPRLGGGHRGPHHWAGCDRAPARARRAPAHSLTRTLTQPYPYPYPSPNPHLTLTLIPSPNPNPNQMHPIRGDAEKFRGEVRSTTNPTRARART